MEAIEEKNYNYHGKEGVALKEKLFENTKLLSKGPSSLRRQILVFTMSMILICTLVIGLSLFQASKILVRRNHTESTLSQISHAAYIVEQDLNEIQELMDYIFVDKQIQSALDRDIRTAYDRTLQWNEIYMALNTYERLDCFRDINCIILYNADGYAHSFRYMALDTSKYLQRNQELGWYQAAIENEGRLVWSTAVTAAAEDYAPYESMIGTDISAMRALRVQSYQYIQGVVYLSIRPTCLSIMQSNHGLDGMYVYLLDDTGRLLNTEADIELLNMSKQLLAGAKWENPEYRYYDNGEYVAYEHIVPDYGYRLIVLQPDGGTYAMDNTIFYLGVLIIFVLLLISVSLWFFLTRLVIRPVRSLADTMQSVNTLGLTVRAEASGSAEFDYLAHHFNFMLDRIKQLMDTNLEKERAAQEAEHKAVLAQITPHFVYNALFAIRMMAIIQNAENIQDMVDALWRMLKNSTSRGKTDFTLKDEIQNVEDYIHILKATNVHKFHVTYDVDPDLLEIACPKFIIQPVVENAIMHGVLPKQGFSTIMITAHQEGDEVVIMVENDGLPITADRLAQVNSTLGQAHKGLGLSSIHQRLQLLYGTDAGLTITSDENLMKTVVQIRYGMKERNDHV